MSNWLPIDSAPKDGPIWLACVSCMRVGYWSSLHKTWLDLFDSRNNSKLAYTPTHWMELPKLPNDEPITVNLNF